MGFLNGRVTFTRYRVSGSSPLPFADGLLALAEQRAAGRHRSADPSDGVSTGWSAGDHVLDLTFDLAKNVVNDALHLAIRIDTDKIPGTLLKAYTQIETEALAKLNPSGHPTKAQRLEAKETARLRAEAEAADGRFRRLNHYPVLWDGQTGVLYAGSTSTTVLERLGTLFRETFDRTLEPITAGSLATSLSGPDDDDANHKRLAEGTLSLFGGEQSELSTVTWAENAPNMLDHLGNEFMVWLWHALQNDSDTVQLADGSEVAVMLTKTLTLDCPRGETGRDSLTDDAPTRLPEALRALQSGKLPRKAGLIVVRHGAQYELTLQAETLAVSGALIPKPEDGKLAANEVRIARIDSLRHLTETLDLLFDAYRRRRAGSGWSQEVSRIRRWLTAA
jgi:hypothetical protein